MQELFSSPLESEEDRETSSLDGLDRFDVLNDMLCVFSFSVIGWLCCFLEVVNKNTREKIHLSRCVDC